MVKAIRLPIAPAASEIQPLAPAASPTIATNAPASRATTSIARPIDVDRPYEMPASVEDGAIDPPYEATTPGRSSDVPIERYGSAPGARSRYPRRTRFMA